MTDLERLEADLSAAIADSTDLATLEACWKWRLGLLGKQVEAECLDGVCQGRLIEVGWAGLEIETGPNQIRRVLPEAVRQLRSQS